MYEEPSTRKTWSPFFSGRASPAVTPDGETFEISPFSGLSFSGFAAGMGGMWAVRAPLATPDAAGSVDKRYSAGSDEKRRDVQTARQLGRHEEDRQEIDEPERAERFPKGFALPIQVRCQRRIRSALTTM